MVEPPREEDEAVRPADAAGSEDDEGDAPVDVSAEGDADGAAAVDDHVDAAASAGHDHTQPGRTAPSAGTLLREAREKRGLSLEDLARTLNLHPRIVRALEHDDEAALPAAPFVRGYLRSYARLMSMDPAPLLDDHERRTGGVVVEVRPTPRVEEPVEGPGLVHKRPGTIMTIATIGLVAVVVGALLLLGPEAFQRRIGGDPQTPTATAPPQAAPAPRRSLPVTSAPAEASAQASAASSPSPQASAASSPSPQGSPPTSPPEPAIGGAGDAPAAGPAPGSDRLGAAARAADAPEALAEPRPDATPAESGPGAAEAAVDDDDIDAADAPADDGILRTRTADGLRVYAGGDDHLHFAFTEDCWVEVRDGDDVQVFQDLAREGEALDLWGRAPFRIRLGYAPAVELTYNGSRVALRPFTRNDVASLTLGR